MRLLILAAALSACVPYAGAYRAPPTPSAFWIWPTRAEADRHRRENPGVRLCVARVPDGFATRGC